MQEDKPVLVTGSAGFIGFHFTRKLLEAGRSVIGVDNLNDYYDASLKEARLRMLEAFPAFRFRRIDLADEGATERLFRENGFETVVHLAAQAGVRYSLENPRSYGRSNLSGFLNVLEGCRARSIGHLLFASSSSVYGANAKLPFSVHDNVDHPISLYAATKKANELMAHSYAHLYGIPSTGLRFFTVYGPWGRPDMALFLFVRAILAGEPIRVFNNGILRRDFTYIDDIVEAMLKIMDSPPGPNPGWEGLNPDPGASFAPYRIYNIGNGNPVQVLEFIAIIEECLRMKAKKQMLPMQPGDVRETWADMEDLARDFGFHPRTSLRDGISSFITWYKSYYGIDT